MTRQVAGSPLLLDELLDPNLLNIVPDRQQFVAELDNRIRAAAADDPEQQYEREGPEDRLPDSDGIDSIRARGFIRGGDEEGIERSAVGGRFAPQ